MDAFLRQVDILHAHGSKTEASFGAPRQLAIRDARYWLVCLVHLAGTREELAVYASSCALVRADKGPTTKKYTDSDTSHQIRLTATESYSYPICCPQ